MPANAYIDPTLANFPSTTMGAIMQNQNVASEIALRNRQAEQAAANTAATQKATEVEELQRQQQQRALDDDQAMRTWLKDPQNQYAFGQGNITGLAGKVSPPVYQKLQSNMLDAIQKHMAIGKDQLDLHDRNLGEIQKGFDGLMQLGGGDDSDAAKQARREAWPGLVQELQKSGALNGVQVPNAISGSTDELKQLAVPLNISKGLNDAALDRAKKTAETQQALAAAGKSGQEAAGARRTQAIQELSGIVNPSTGAPDPAAYAKLQQKYSDILPAASLDQKGTATLLRSGVPLEKQPEYDIDANKAAMGIVGNSDFETTFLPAYAANLGKKPNELTPAERMASFTVYKQVDADPALRASLLASRATTELLHRLTLSQQPTEEDAKNFANDILNHRIAPDQLSTIRGRGAGALGVLIEREMKKADPTFNWEQAASEYNLAKSPGFQQQVRYMDYVGSSIDNVVQAADKLANGNVRSINALVNAGKDQFNNVNLAKFNTDRLEVSDAIAKILQGGGTASGTSDMKLKQAQELIRKTDDPEVVRATLGEVKKLIGNRRSTLTKGTFLENEQGTGAAAIAEITSKADYDKLAKGAHYMNNGVEYVKR